MTKQEIVDILIAEAQELTDSLIKEFIVEGPEIEGIPEADQLNIRASILMTAAKNLINGYNMIASVLPGATGDEVLNSLEAYDGPEIETEESEKKEWN